MSPQLAPEAIDRLIRDEFGLDALQAPLPSYSDLNIALEVEGERAWVLKVANSDEPEEVLDFQQQALVHLALADPDLRIPHLRHTVSGGTRTSVVSPKGEQHVVWMVSYLPGRFLADLPLHPPSLLGGLGGFLGRLDRALAGFSHPAMHRTLKWDLRQARTALPFLPLIPDPHDRAIVGAIFERFERDIAGRLEKLRRQVIHNDANDHNVLVGTDEDIAGIIDFGDMIHTALVCEPAIAAAYALLGKPDPIAAATQVFEGFHAVYPLLEEEWEIGMDLVRLRLAMSVCYSAYERARSPENDYIRVSEAPAWAALRHFAALSTR